MSTYLRVINGRFFYSKVVSALEHKTNQYGEPRIVEAALKFHCASKFAKYSTKAIEPEEISEIVAKGITLALELDKPVYGDVGEAFLKKKVVDYKKGMLGLILTKLMLQKVEEAVPKEKEEAVRVKGIILKEAEKISKGDPDLIEEAKAAIIAIKLYDGANKYSDRNDFNSVSTSLSGKILRATRANGCVTEVPSISSLLEQEPEKKIIIRTNQNMKELEEAYLYYTENYHEIPEEFITAAEDFSRESIIAYYVASLGEPEIRKIYANRVR